MFRFELTLCHHSPWLCLHFLMRIGLLWEFPGGRLLGCLQVWGPELQPPNSAFISSLTDGFAIRHSSYTDKFPLRATTAGPLPPPYNGLISLLITSIQVSVGVRVFTQTGVYTPTELNGNGLSTLPNSSLHSRHASRCRINEIFQTKYSLRQ